MSNQHIATGFTESTETQSQNFELEHYFTSESNDQRCVLIPTSGSEANLATQWIAADNDHHVSVNDMR